MVSVASVVASKPADGMSVGHWGLGSLPAKAVTSLIFFLVRPDGLDNLCAVARS
jgi:hypothetical protein